MKLLLTSAGISNNSIRTALEELLGKPVAESTAFFVPTAIYAIPNGGDIIRRVINGSLGDPFCDMGWKSLSILELTALPASIPHYGWRSWKRPMRYWLAGAIVNTWFTGSAVGVSGHAAIAASKNGVCRPERREHVHGWLWHHLW